MERQVDWATWLNRLTFCHGCGRFGMPQKGKAPKGWKLLYQPHPDGRPGLHVCSKDCEGEVRKAMEEGPIIEPLEMRPPPMPHELQEQVRELVKGVAEDERSQQQTEALRHLQDAVDVALVAALEANGGKLTKREAIDVAADAIVDTHCHIGMAVTANVEIDENAVATAEVVVISRRDPRHLAGAIEDLPGVGLAHQEMMDLFRGVPLPRFPVDEPIPFTPVVPVVDESPTLGDIPWSYRGAPLPLSLVKPKPDSRHVPQSSWIESPELPLGLMPPEPGMDEEQFMKEMEFMTLKSRDTEGVVVNVDFRPSHWKEEDDDGEGRPEADRRGKGNLGREIEGAHDAETGATNRGYPATDEARCIASPSTIEGKEEPPGHG